MKTATRSLARRPALRRGALPAVLLAVLLAGPAALLLAGPAQAASTVTVELGSAPPADVTIAAGDSVVFTNAEQGALPADHRVTSATADGAAQWTYDSGALAPGKSAAPVAFPQPGTYVYTDTRSGLGLPVGSSTGRIVVNPAPAQAAPAAGGSTAAPAPGTPSRAAASPAPGRTGAPAPAPALPGGPPGTGSGSAALTPFSGQAGLPQSAPSAGAVVPPAVAPLFATGQLPVTAQLPGATLPPVAAVPGPLPGVAAQRALGLAATVAAVACIGVVSLLVRVLLSDPAGRRRPVLPVRVEQPAH